MSNKFNIQGYEIYPSQRLGAGAYGQVYIGQNLRTNQIVAVKIIDIQKLSKKALQKMIKVEINLLKQIKHPNILEVIETKQTEEFFYLITQKCDSDLEKLMRVKKQFTQQECLYIIFQICEAFKELKSRNILHRDLKPSNILIKNGIFKLADFGVSKQIVPDALCKNTTRVGTPLYMSMQVLRGEQYNQKCDIWSLGCIMYKLLHGQLLWEQKSDQQIMKIFETTKQVSVPIKRTDLSQNCRLFLQSCLRLKEEDRSSWLALASIPLNKQKEQIRKKQEEIKESFMRLVQPNLSWSVSKQSQQSPQTGKSTNVNSNTKKSATDIRDYNDQHQRTCFDAIFGCCFQFKNSQNKYVDSNPKSNLENTFSEINLPIVVSQIKQSSPKLIQQSLVLNSQVLEQKNEAKREQPQRLIQQLKIPTQQQQMMRQQQQMITKSPEKPLQQQQTMTRQPQEPNEQDSSSSQQPQPSKSSSADTQQVKEALENYIKMQILKAYIYGLLTQNQDDEEENENKNQAENPDSKAQNPKTKSDHQTNNSKTAQLQITESQRGKQQNKAQNHADLNNIDEKQKQQVINVYKKPIVLQGKKLSDSKMYVDVKEIKQINGQRKYYTNMDEQIQSLFHSNLAIEMNEFCHFNWTALKFICLKNCQVDNYQWKIFVQNAFIFNNIHKIQIQKNQISTVKGQDLEKFKQLSCIIFHVNSQQTNPLSPMSKQSLRNFKRKNQKVEVQYELQQQEKPQCINM